MLPYRSPYHIMYYFGAFDPEEDPGLKRLQKKFIAEFNLLDSPFLRINDTEYSKHSILQSLDELRALRPDNMHRAIFSHAAALSFFGHPKVLPDHSGLKAFLDSVSKAPYFKEVQELLLSALQESSKHVLSQHQYRSYLGQAGWGSYLQAYQQEELQQVVKTHIAGLVKFLVHWHEHQIRLQEVEAKLNEDLAFLMTDDFIDFMNSLSEDFEQHEQALNKSFVYFIDYCFQNYNLSPGFYYKLIDHLLNLEGLEKGLRQILNRFRFDVHIAEMKEREIIRQIVREPGEVQQPLVLPAAGIEMSEERKALLRKNMAREFLFTRIMKGIGISILVLMVTGGILHPFYHLSMSILLLALLLLVVLLGLWALKGFFTKKR